MLVKIWNKKNNEVLVAMEWNHGRLDSKRYNMIVSELFFLACEGCEYNKLIATFDNSPQRIETLTCVDGSTIDMVLYVDGQIVKLMNISS